MRKILSRALLALLAALPLHALTPKVSVVPLRGAPTSLIFGAPHVLPSLSAAAPFSAALPAPALIPGRPDKAPAPAPAPQTTPATPADGWASRFDFQPEGRFFDGGRTLKSEAGAIFVAVPKGHDSVRVHIVERAPLAAVRSVPGTEGLSGKTLLDALNAISARGHLARPYNETSDYMFSTADNVVINGVRGVVDSYSGIFVPGTSKEGRDYPEPGDANGDGFSDSAGMNVEHTWPQSMFNRALPERSDIHHLTPTFMHPNSIRGHLPFGVVTGRPDYENKAGAKRGNGVFEPPKEVKGVIARRQLYFYTRHKNSRMFGRTSVAYWNKQIDILMQWNREYPPDTAEAQRNDFGETWQGNRNPFIDDHLLAERIGADAFRAKIAPRGAQFRRDHRR